MSTRDRIFLLLLFVGFATFVFEVRYEHRYVVKDHWEGWIPIVYSGVAAVACLLGMAKHKAMRTIAATILFLGVVVSGIGIYHHTKFEPARFEKFLFPDRTVYSAEKTSDGERKTVSLPAPLAAPMGILGLASIGFIVTSGLFRSGKSN